jgi:hypothetical protein
MEYDPQSQSRLMLLHLVVGKVRDGRAGRHHPGPGAPKSNFAISTPTAVAAARDDPVGLHGRPEEHDGGRARGRLHRGELPGRLEAVARAAAARSSLELRDHRVGLPQPSAELAAQVRQ